MNVADSTQDHDPKQVTAPASDVNPQSSETIIPGATAKEERIAEFDGIRGVAILLVFLFHIKPPSESPLHGPIVDFFAGPLWCGVDLFFVLSGFLITGILADTRENKRYFLNFYARRTVRIFPLYYGVVIGLFAVLPLLAMIPLSPLNRVVQGSYYQQLSGNQIWLWFYLQNFLQATGKHTLPGLGHFWSLAIEEQFYLVWPLLVYAMSRGRMLAFSVVVATSGILVRWWMYENGWDSLAIRHLTYARVDALAAGAVVALALRFYSPERLIRISRVFMAVSVVAIAVLVFRQPGLSRSTFEVTVPGYSFFALFFASFIMLTALRRMPEIVSRILCSQFLLPLGTLSYGIYVFHWPILHGCRALVPKISPGYFSGSPLAGYLCEVALTIGLTLVVSWFSWRLYERPFLRLKKYFRYHVS